MFVVYSSQFDQFVFERRQRLLTSLFDFPSPMSIVDEFQRLVRRIICGLRVLPLAIQRFCLFALYRPRYLDLFREISETGYSKTDCRKCAISIKHQGFCQRQVPMLCGLLEQLANPNGIAHILAIQKTLSSSNNLFRHQSFLLLTKTVLHHYLLAYFLQNKMPATSRSSSKRQAGLILAQMRLLDQTHY